MASRIERIVAVAAILALTGRISLNRAEAPRSGEFVDGL
jgi:hypothetical protein